MTSSTNVELKPGIEPILGYRLLKRLGRGGFGEVWEAVHETDGAHLAFKFLDCNQQIAALVVNEIRILIQLRELQHQNLLQFFSVTASQNLVILSMELAEGSLNDLHYIYRMDQKTHVPPNVLLNLMGQAAEGIDFISRQKISGGNFFSQGMQHCDIKPSNLLLIRNVLKVADFGLSGPQMWNARGKAFGTPPYAPPELYEGRPNARSDQYSLAVTYCELRTGYYPFPVTTDGVFPNIAPELSMLPDAERPVVAKALSKQWLNRYSSCAEFVGALAQVIDPNGPALKAQRRSSQPKNGRI